MDGSSLWGLLTVVGPILLAAVVLWAVLNNRRSRGEKRQTEEATRNLYKEVDRKDKATGGRDV